MFLRGVGWCSRYTLSSIADGTWITQKTCLRSNRKRIRSGIFLLVNLHIGHRVLLSWSSPSEKLIVSRGTNYLSPLKPKLIIMFIVEASISKILILPSKILLEYFYFVYQTYHWSLALYINAGIICKTKNMFNYRARNDHFSFLRALHITISKNYF